MSASTQRILVLTSCTGVKARVASQRLTAEDFALGRDHIDALHTRNFAGTLTPAERLYQGQQHLRLMRGVDALRATRNFELDLWILSAGYGLIPGDRQLAPYDCTFHGMGKNATRDWSHARSIPTDVRTLLATRYDLALLLLGENYLEACQLDPDIALGGPTLALCAPSVALRLPPLGNLQVLRLGVSEARRFSCGLVGLKGEVAARLLFALSEDPASLDGVCDEAQLADRLARCTSAPRLDAEIALF